MVWGRIRFGPTVIERGWKQFNISPFWQELEVFHLIVKNGIWFQLDCLNTPFNHRPATRRLRTDYLKPTRLLLGGFTDFPAEFVLQEPSFDDQGYYAGPLKQRTSATQLVGWARRAFATTGSEQWPSLMCRWVAVAICTKFTDVANAQLSVLAGDGVHRPLDRKYPINTPDGGKLSGGTGKPRECQLPGKERHFFDGAGLTSIGRWDFENRIWSKGPFWDELRKGSLELVQSHLGHNLVLDRGLLRDGGQRR